MLTRDEFIVTGAGFARASRGAGRLAAIAVLAVTLAAVLSGCGQKGSLVLAKPLPATPSSAPAATPAAQPSASNARPAR